MMDLVQRRAAQELLALSVDIEVQLQQKTGGAPLAFHLKRSLARAAEAMAELAHVEATDANRIRDLQMQVKMHQQLIDDLKHIVALGKDAEEYLDQDEGEDLAQALGLTPGEDASTPEED